jgi:hypothetical protein
MKKNGYWKSGSDLIGIESLEEVDSFLEIIHHILLRVIVGIARGLQSTDTGSVFVPLVLPEIFVISFVIFPVYAHIV